MTASLLNPAFLTEFNQRHHLHEMQTFRRNLSCGRQAVQIKKNLFGTPKPAETKKHCTEQLEKHQEKAAQKWGFDFRNGSPLNNANTQFIWERVTKTEIVPQMYTLTRAAHIREEPKITAYDVLLDERADRANLSSSTIEEDSCEDSQDESVVTFEVPSASAAPSNVAAAAVAQQKHKRQPKITEYMKKRKRLAQTPKKISPSKRARTTSASSSSSSTSSISSLHSSFKALQRNH